MAYIHHLAEEVCVASLNDIYKYHASEDAPAVRVPKQQTRQTRQAADMCFSCQLPCKTHEIRAYTTCKKCKLARISMECLQVPGSVKRMFDPAKHEEVLAAKWLCGEC